MNATEQSSRSCTVLVVDVAGSSAVADFEALRDRHILALNRRHEARDWVARPYTVTAWDEFQTVLTDWSRVSQVLLDIRLAFAPLSVYVGVGFGEVSGWASEKPINQALSGPGFERARQAIDQVKHNKGEKFPRLSRFVTGSSERDAQLDLVYALHDTLVAQVSERQWEMMAQAGDADSQEALARHFDVEPSTVTRNLKRGHYWQLRETVAVLSRQMRDGILALDETIS